MPRATLLLLTCAMLTMPLRPAHSAPARARTSTHARPGGKIDPQAQFRQRRLALEMAYSRRSNALDAAYARDVAALDRRRKQRDYRKQRAELDHRYKKLRDEAETAYRQRLASIRRESRGR